MECNFNQKLMHKFVRILCACAFNLVLLLLHTQTQHGPINPMKYAISLQGQQRETLISARMCQRSSNKNPTGLGKA